ncbi:MAG: hypothetical protein GY832_31925 [Chloroflexi bacterium]|nr:hypothetical protein [Chloroflexota bacterium]
MTSKKSFLIVVLVMIAIITSNVFGIPSRAQNEDCEYFEDVGHYVCDEFLQFFQEHGELEIFGYPLTEAFYDPNLGLRVQYFQRARMEWHPNNPELYQVQLGLLVDELGYHFPDTDPEKIPLFNTHLRRYFPETNHIVSYAFLDYFQDHGGVDIFGYPRSEAFNEGGHQVQYFQRARMEWRPEAQFGLQMHLTNLGEIYVESEVPLEYAARIKVPERILELDVRASVRHVSTGQDGKQTVFIYVTDRQNPIKDVEVTITVRYAPGKEHHYECEPTDEHGFSTRSFDIPSRLVSPGQKVVIDVVVTRSGLIGSTQTFFLSWW